jgi:parathyroid hormone receptor 1
LRCQRNILHMHLFASFMVRAFMFLLKNILFVAGVGLSTDVLIKNGNSYWLADKFESNWHCKAFTSIWQYCILANYSWILMEGLYLHNLIFCALFADSNANITIYIILGWGENYDFLSRINFIYFFKLNYSTILLKYQNLDMVFKLIIK